jgi:hypothetical protein
MEIVAADLSRTTLTGSINVLVDPVRVRPDYPGPFDRGLKTHGYSWSAPFGQIAVLILTPMAYHGIPHSAMFGLGGCCVIPRSPGLSHKHGTMVSNRQGVEESETEEPRSVSLLGA